MRILRQLEPWLRVAVVAAAAWAGWILVSRTVATRRWVEQRKQDEPQPANWNASLERAYGGTGLRILQFYAREGTVVEGQSTLLCYGLTNARAVRVEPSVSGVSVSFNRCVEITPERDTSYTLTAEGMDGRTASQSVLVKVAPDPDTLPKIDSFRVEKHRVEEGHHIFLVAFSFHNAKEVSVEPEVFHPLHDSAPFGQFYVAPTQTTTYTLTVTGKHGRRARQELTVEVPSR